jgi:hypothetical protein
VIDPMLVILVPPAVVFGWAMMQMHRVHDEAPEAVRLNSTRDPAPHL